jgi:hypothetical protein
MKGKDLKNAVKLMPITVKEIQLMHNVIVYLLTFVF